MSHDLHRCVLRFSRTSKDHNYPVAITRHRAPGTGAGWMVVMVILLIASLATSWVTR